MLTLETRDCWDSTGGTLFNHDWAICFNKLHKRGVYTQGIVLETRVTPLVPVEVEIESDVLAPYEEEMVSGPLAEEMEWIQEWEQIYTNYTSDEVTTSIPLIEVEYV